LVDPLADVVRLFGDRYKAVLVEGKQGAYYETLTDYIHLNPVRAGRIRPKEGASIRDYPWSSVAAGYALSPGRRPNWWSAETAI
jgi:putative transposase